MAAIKRFGSWGNAINASGLRYEDIKHSYSGEDELYIMLCQIFNNVHRHYEFEWLVFKRKMHVDFYIPSLNIAIERQGEQHYHPVCFGGISHDRAKRNLKITRQRDKHKRKLLKQNNIRLLIVPYCDKLDKVILEERIKNVCCI